MEVILVAIGFAIGIVPCWAWGKCGGDERWKKRMFIRKALKSLHHWMFGLGIMVIGLCIWNPLVFGIGWGTFVDDALFHSYEQYFKRS